MNNVKVSIIIPIFHQGNFLNKSIPSIMNQTYDNIEIICVNDGSTEEDKNIIYSYQKCDERIQIINKKNGGLVDATISGIQNATGDYICFLDPDDMVGSDYVENFVNEIDNCDCVAMGFFYNDYDKMIPYYLKDDYVYEGIELEKARNVFLTGDSNLKISNTFFISRWNKLYRREVLNKVVLKFEDYKDITLGEDTLFTFLVLLNCKKIKTVKATNSYYYNISNTSSMMKSYDIDQHIYKSEMVFKALKNLLKENKCDINQSYALFFNEVNTLWNRIDKNDYDNWINLENIINSNLIYSKCIQCDSPINRLKFFIRKRYYKLTTPKIHSLLMKIRG